MICCEIVVADAEDVGEADLQPLLAGDVDAGDTCHAVLRSYPCRCLWRGFWQMTITRP